VDSTPPNRIRRGFHGLDERDGEPADREAQAALSAAVALVLPAVAACSDAIRMVGQRGRG
jgi:hypothetical protein